MNEPSRMLLEIDHANMVLALAKPGQAILDTLSPNTMHLVHCTSKLCSEAGELMGCVGKLAYYNKPLDRANAVEELGDIEFYLQGIRQGLGITREETLKANMDKLAERYAGFKYSDQAAQERKDKQ